MPPLCDPAQPTPETSIMTFGRVDRVCELMHQHMAEDTFGHKLLVLVAHLDENALLGNGVGAFHRGIHMDAFGLFLGFRGKVAPQGGIHLLQVSVILLHRIQIRVPCGHLTEF